MSIVVFVAKRSGYREHSLREQRQTSRTNRLPLASLAQDCFQQDAGTATKKPFIRSVKFSISQMTTGKCFERYFPWSRP